MFKFTRKPNENYDEFGGDNGYYDFNDSQDVVEDDMQGFGMDAAPEKEEPAAAPIALKIVSPKGYENAAEIADNLMNGNTVLLNLESIYQDRAQTVRLLDYLSGAIHVCGGIMTKVGKTTIVVSPKNVDVSSIEAMVNGN